MEKPSKWEYCKDVTMNHLLVRKYELCCESLNTVCMNEGAKKSPFSNEVCLNIDKFEKHFAKSEKRNACSTMDISFGLRNGSETRVALCELRLNYRNINNLSKTELDAKILNSRDILGHSPIIHSPHIFVFDSNLKNQAERTLRRLYSNKKHTLALDLNDLKQTYFV